MVAAVEMALAANIGATLFTHRGFQGLDGGTIAVKSLADAQWWFGEDQGRYIVTTKNPEAIHRWCNTSNMARYYIGFVGGSALNIPNASIPLTALREASDSFFRDWMEG